MYRKKSQKLLGVLLVATLVGGANSAVAVRAEDDWFTRAGYYLSAHLDENDAKAKFELGKRYLEENNQDEAVRWLKSAADQGFPEACLELSRFYLQYGYVDDVQRYLKLALDAGMPEAQLALADHFDRGTGGFPKDYKQAFAAYYTLAKNGNSKAMHALAFYFFRGLHGAKSEIAAAHWYHEAAKSGHIEANDAYAWMAKNGIGTQQDVEEAAWYAKRAKRLQGESKLGAKVP